MREEARKVVDRIASAVQAGDYLTAVADARRLYQDATSEAERAELLAILGPRTIPPAHHNR
ncbi:hypothetical protein [Streptomyces sp. NPDC048419]|uniref:hypothetical protein n=1 Tax=Streptomyces sp. NPDC048419 TaxID=3365547 RepID=UPI0037183597